MIGRMQGLHLTADLHGCLPGGRAHAAMTDRAALRELCLAAVQRSGLAPVGELFHRFEPAGPGEPAGVTGVVLLAESHLAVHTWPELGAVTLEESGRQVAASGPKNALRNRLPSPKC